jgi:hypothetical protein
MVVVSFLHDGVRRVESVYWLVSYVSPVHLTFSEGVRMSLFYSAEQTYSAASFRAFSRAAILR